MTTSVDGGSTNARGGYSPHATRRDVLGLAVLGLAAAPSGQLTYGVHVSLAPAWFDPAETTEIITPFMLLYALHDALVKAMPGKLLAPSLAKSWTATEDGLSYEFVLPEGAKLHNGEPVTADDVKFSFERYRGADHAALQVRVEAIETPDPRHVRFKLKQPWPDFLTFYGDATGAGWIVPRKYLEKVGDDGFRNAPIGAGPYKFVSFDSGVQLLLEVFDQYWRKTPSGKTLVLKVIPDEATRLAALKAGEIDIAYSIQGELADEPRHTPGLTLKPVVLQGTFWLYFTEQWDPKSSWHDPRVRQAVDLAIGRTGINQAMTLGFSRVTRIVPDIFDFYWPPPAPVYDPAKAKQLLAGAGHANGFDAGLYTCDSSYANLGEAVPNNLEQVGIHSRLRPLERASFFSGYTNKSFKGIIQGASGAFGNAATRMEAIVIKDGAFCYGSYPDIDALSATGDRAGPRTAGGTAAEDAADGSRQDDVAPIWQLGFINGVGPRVAESSFGSIAGFAYTAPYEDLAIKSS